jgi:hypothetical protein
MTMSRFEFEKNSSRGVWERLHTTDDGKQLWPSSEELALAGLCSKKCERGGSCCLWAGHAGGCECIGDDPGQPGTCPA